MKISSQIKDLRNSIGVTQGVLAKHLGMSEQAYRRQEKEDTLKSKTIESICEFFNVEIIFKPKI